MTSQTEGTVVNNRRVKSSYYLLGLHCPQIADEMRPGQFVMLRSSDDGYPLLRRPFSIYKSNPLSSPEINKRGSISILYKKIGKGTQRMTEFRKGQIVDLIGPLGNGFMLPTPPLSGSVILIGGGVGIVSLYPLAEALGKEELVVFIGGKTRDDILCTGDFRKLNSHIFVATEDGTLGFRGTVIDLFLSQRERLERKKPPHYLYSCGSMEMLKELARTVESGSFNCQVSLEARMACGFGACWGCVVKTTHPQKPYQRVCKEGPVFHLRDIAWE
jgi:dihydroorotate dehydrogenase electron transfer subunit